MSKPNKVKVLNKDGVWVEELCHDITTCREHRIKFILTQRRQYPSDVVIVEDEDAVTTEDAMSVFYDTDDINSILARDSHPSVRNGVAENPLADPELLNLLSRDENWTVRMSVGFNRSTPTDALELLSKDANANVRQAVAENPTTPVHVLQVLTKDENEDVAFLASHTLEYR